MERPASYYFDTLETQRITRHTDHGFQDSIHSLCEFFGTYFVIFTSDADAQELGSINGSFDAANQIYQRLLKQHNVVAAA